MNGYLRQSTSGQVIGLGQFFDSTDGDTEETALTINNTDILIRKSSSTSLVSKNLGGATHMSRGVYQTSLDSTDTDTVGILEVYVHVAGALAVKSVFNVVDAATYDAMFTNGLNNFNPSTDTVTISGTKSTLDALNDISVANILNTQMTESYAADGVAPTLAQAVFLIQQALGDFAISGTTISVKQLDGTTQAAAYTLDDGSTPTSRTRTG